jgi:hypothetical protein
MLRMNYYTDLNLFQRAGFDDYICITFILQTYSLIGANYSLHSPILNPVEVRVNYAGRGRNLLFRYA